MNISNYHTEPDFAAYHRINTAQYIDRLDYIDILLKKTELFQDLHNQFSLNVVRFPVTHLGLSVLSKLWRHHVEMLLRERKK